MSARTHGLSTSREYGIWQGMIKRCTNPKNRAFHRYGGRGIAVCRRWLKSFSAFHADMGPCPAGLTLERNDNNKGYSPANCVWATRQQQNNNRRDNLILEFNGKRMSLAAWARELKLSEVALRCRILRGWPVPLALTTPIGAPRRTSLMLTFHGRTAALTTFANELGIPGDTLRARLESGWSVNKALTVPLGADPPHWRYLTFEGRTLPLKRWARLRGMDPGTLSGRLRAGWPVEEALTASTVRAGRSLRKKR
jgi:lambda repressor-like predicted transcriptional regulator